MAKRRANGEGSIRKQKNTRQIIFSARNFAMDQRLLPAGHQPGQCAAQAPPGLGVGGIAEGQLPRSETRLCYKRTDPWNRWEYTVHDFEPHLRKHSTEYLRTRYRCYEKNSG